MAFEAEKHFEPSILSGLVLGDPKAFAECVGCIALPFTAGAALNIGDNVYLSAAKTVNKSTTQANYKGVVGIVVGGESTGMLIKQADADIGTAAAPSGGLVLVAVLGFAKAVADGGITLGNPVTADNTTAGRVETATITTDVAAGDTGLVTGIAMQTVTTAGDILTILVGCR